VWNWKEGGQSSVVKYKWGGKKLNGHSETTRVVRRVDWFLGESLASKWRAETAFCGAGKEQRYTVLVCTSKVAESVLFRCQNPHMLLFQKANRTIAPN
jgi:hypothetical protein